MPGSAAMANSPDGSPSRAGLADHHPHSFYCPISQQCMHDPVVLADGHTYERRHIEEWLRQHDTSPVSGLKLAEKILFPNHALRNAIEEYFQQVFSVHRRAIRRTIASAPRRQSSFGSNAALLRTVDALMECSVLVHADLSSEQALRHIMEEARTLVGAEVASVFLVDRERGELYSNVNSTEGELRIPITAGIAGRVARTGEPVNVPDAYSHECFHKSVDAKTGFRTRNIICVPMKTKLGGIIGVAQLVNKTQGGVVEVNTSWLQEESWRGGDDELLGFNADDLQFLQVFASQAATAVAGSPGGLEREGSRSGVAGPAAGHIDSSCSHPSAGTQAAPGASGEECAQLKAGPRLPLADAQRADGGATVELLLAKALGSWHLDALALEKLSGGRPLSTLGCFLFDRLGLVDRFSLDRGRLGVFLAEIERGYADNPYHNRVHAASVLHSMHALLSKGRVADATVRTISGPDGNGQLETMACLLAAAVHDYEHRGLSNDFLVRTHDEWALRYNDRHVNENHHVAAAFSLLRRPEYNFLEKLSSGEYHRLRSLVVDLVLSTDMANNETVKAFGSIIDRATSVVLGTAGDTSCRSTSTEAEFVPDSPKDAMLALQVAMKCADVGHLALEWADHCEWTRRLEAEFFEQGDRERELGLSPISFLMDREKPGVSETQVGFFSAVALPLFQLLNRAFPSTLPVLSAATANYERWRDIAQRNERTKQMLSESFDSWHLDTLELSRLTDDRPLSTLGSFLFDRLGLVDRFSLDRGKLGLFFTEVERGYADNPYHNRAHAASVLFSMHALLSKGGAADAVVEAISGPEGDGQLEVMACLLAAAAHDYEHGGVSNDFLVRTHDERALRYNDRNVNENHHAAAAFAVLRRPECNFLDRLSPGEYRRLRRLFVDLVLSTDMADNSSAVAAFAAAVGGAGSVAEVAGDAGTGNCSGCSVTQPGFRPDSEKDAVLALQVVTKCADLGHLALGRAAHEQWVSRLEAEFFAQGDRERALGLSPISMFMDRDGPGASHGQVGFFDCVALPLFRELARAFPRTAPVLRAVVTNREAWRSLKAGRDQDAASTC